jgi:hypothetical protein
MSHKARRRPSWKKSKFQKFRKEINKIVRDKDIEDIIPFLKEAIVQNAEHRRRKEQSPV